MPEIVLATHDNSCVVTVVGRPEKTAINPLALKDILKEHGWAMATI